MMTTFADRAGALLVLALLLSCPVAALHAADAPGRPNILLLFADDQRADTIAAWGNRHIRTPNLDRLVKGGFSFRNNYCFGSNSGAVCVPSRAMLMTGRTWLDVKLNLDGAVLLPEILRKGGYATFATGKWHNGEPSFRRAFPDARSVFFGGMADHTKVPIADVIGGNVVNRRVAKKFSSEQFADTAIDFLGSYKGEKPFFCYVAFTAPHDPRMPPVKYREMYYKNRPPLPANFLTLPAFDNGFTKNIRDENLAAYPRTKEDISDQLCEYYGMITHLDEQVGRILAALERAGHAKNTLVLYAADHGLALGSHGLLGKQSLYEHSMKCPLIVSGPGVPAGQSTGAFSYLFDLFPTIAEAAGVKPTSKLAGESLRPLWTGERKKIRDSVFLPYSNLMRSVRDERWKLIVYPPINHRELFDLRADPHETHNLAEDKTHAGQIERLTALMKEWQKKVGDKQPLTVAKPRPKAVSFDDFERKPDPWQPKWVVDKYFKAADRPNIIFIFADDHAYQAISAYGDPRKLIDTPNIDRLAREGARFDRCLVPNSICGPSRACVLTGKYSHINGFYNNTNSRFDGAQTTFPKLLQKAGYQTAMVGKWHLVSNPTGFDYWHILPGQGVYYNPPMIDNGKRVAHQGYVTDLISDISIDWLKKRDRTKPFLLMTHHKAPHREWSPALRHLGHDKDRKYPEPATLFDDYANQPTPVKDQDMTLAKTFTPLDAKLTPPPNMTAEQRAVWNAYYEPRNKAFRAAKLTGKDLVRWRYNRYLHDYLGCIKAVDEAVGKLLKFLDDEGLAKNTLVMYCSDQGFYLGEHGWFDKRWIFEESLRTPLLARWPGVARPGTVDRNLTSVVDFAQTFLDAAGVPADKEMQGASLVPLLKGETPKDWRKSFYYEYFEYPTPHHVMPHYGVVTDRYKLVRFYVPTAEGKPKVDYWALYDRQKDPDETKDVHADPAYAGTVKELKAELERLRRELKVPVRVPREAYGGLFMGGRKK